MCRCCAHCLGFLRSALARRLAAPAGPRAAPPAAGPRPRRSRASCRATSGRFIIRSRPCPTRPICASPGDRRHHRGARSDRPHHPQRRRTGVRRRVDRLPTGGHRSGGVSPSRTEVDAETQTATFRFAQPIAPGRYRSRIDYRGKINTQAAGLFALDYQDAQGPKRVAVHPVRGARRAPLLPLLGRAAIPHPLRSQRHRAGRPERGQQHAGGRPRGPARRQQHRHLPHHAGDVELSAVPRGRRVRPDHHHRRRHRDRHRHPPRRRRAGPLGAGKLGADPALVQRLFRHALPAAQARQCRRPRQQPVLRRDGELGRDLLVREHPAGRPGDHQRGAAPGDLRGRRPRDRPPMVRRPRHHGLVGRSVAQRGLRLVDGDQGDRRPASRMGAAARP